MPERRFLVVRLGSLGDIVHTLPAVAALRETFSSAEIVWLTHPRWKLLVSSSKLASKIWTTETRSFASLLHSIKEVRNAGFDTSIDFQGLWKSASLPFLAGIKKRVGFARVRESGVPMLYSDKVKTTTAHVADQNGELSLRAGAFSGVTDFSLEPPALDEASLFKYLKTRNVDKYVVLSPGGGWRSKCWPAERYGALCRLITNSLNLRCVVNYGPGEDDIANQVRTASGDAAPLLFNGELGSLMSLLRHAACVVGADTGPVHLAVALGTPTVALFGPTDPARNGPYRVMNRASANRSSQHSVINREDVVLRAANVTTTHSREGRTHPSMMEIQVEAVFDALRPLAKART